LGARLFKLVFGHRGGNQPVKDLQEGGVEITSHNHGFAVLADSLPPEVEVTHINLNDRCVEGLRHKSLRSSPFNTTQKLRPAHTTLTSLPAFIELMERQ